MKKILSLKTLAVLLILALSVVAFTACVRPNDEKENDKVTYAIPEFSLKIIDGATEYTVTKSDVASLNFASASRTGKSGTTYYKGFSLSDILATKNIARTGIFSVTIGSGTYCSNLEATNISSCVLATVASGTEQDGYVVMTTPDNSPADPEGPIRAVCMAESTGFKSIKNVDTITIQRPAYAIPEFSITITDGEEEYTVNQLDVAALDFTSASRTSKTVTTYFKGFSLADIFASNGISTTGIASINIHDADDTEDTTDVLTTENLEDSILAVVSSATENGTFSLLDSEDGPVRSICNNPPSDFKAMKKVARIKIIRAV